MHMATYDLTAMMASDLKISQYNGEAGTDFKNRVIYSAMACWIKSAALDSGITFPDSSAEVGASRRHIMSRCSRVLAEVLRRYPECKPWFELEPMFDSKEAIRLLRTRLLRHGDLLNVGFQTNIVLAPFSVTPLAPGLECVRGHLLDPSLCYSGVSMLRIRKSGPGPEPTYGIDSVEWLRDYIKSAWWQEVETLDDIEYFDPRQRTRTNYKCWVSAMPKSLDQVILARRTVNDGGYEYLLIRPGANMAIHRIDAYQQKIGNHIRFQFALRSAAQNSPPAESTVYADHVSVQLYTILPEREGRLLACYAWPEGSVGDKLRWNMPLPVWKYIKPYLDRLGLGIREETENG